MTTNDPRIRLYHINDIIMRLKVIMLPVKEDHDNIIDIILCHSIKRIGDSLSNVHPHNKIPRKCDCYVLGIDAINGRERNFSWESMPYPTTHSDPIRSAQ